MGWRFSKHEHRGPALSPPHGGQGRNHSPLRRGTTHPTVLSLLCPEELGGVGLPVHLAGFQEVSGMSHPACLESPESEVGGDLQRLRTSAP